MEIWGHPHLHGGPEHQQGQGLILAHLDRKAHLSRPTTAILAFTWTITHPTPSVLHADQRGVRPFLIWTLGLEFLGHPRPHREPQHQQGQGLILEHIS